MRFDVLTLFPAIFDGYVGQSLLKKGIDSSLIDVQLHDIRRWSRDKQSESLGAGCRLPRCQK